MQRGHNFAIVDEVDSILIDEARTPLIISGPADQPTKWYVEFARVVARLQRDRDYEVDEKKRTVGVLESGITRVEDYLGIDNLYESAHTPLVGYLNNAVKAKEPVQEGQGLRRHRRRGAHRRRAHRPHPGRASIQRGHAPGHRGQGGVQIQNENQTLATITLQNYFRMYDKALGHDGHRPHRGRGVQPDLQGSVWSRSRPTARWSARTSPTWCTAPRRASSAPSSTTSSTAARTASRCSSAPRASRRASTCPSSLRKRGVAHEVLNAKYHEREAAIVAQAGRKGAVTVATNMAGRGTDIMLGGNAEFMAVADLKQRGLDAAETPEEYEAAWPAALEAARKAVEREHEEVTELGGLYVLGTERHESRRIDNQPARSLRPPGRPG
ncbi:hypothetical protein GCM10025868_37120 [Angustibacter aerolatus]|uniref:SecA family profile domain-containing protein n=1 Tax=Angustibacter aerolatus TaxID=1162965 RepID=A0ABQ6JL01_9ACTN|nr:hypothetical protein GCM10025868_37120 [Angustibacter aerolatus]